MKTLTDCLALRPGVSSALSLFRILLLLSLGAVFTPAEPSCAAGSFRFAVTGSLSHARKEHTATLLPDGTVLVAGGNAFNVPGLASTELYDPATGIWTAGRDMVIGRARHTATTSSNGEVLVAGGLRDSDSSIKRTELYDPAQGTWTETGSMMTSRYEHTATLLADGRVLVAGGYVEDNGFSVTASAELYDPATGVWTATASLPLKAGGHTATLLPDGSVLVAGGSNLDLGVVTNAELYNPATGVWTSTDSLTTARAGHTATLLENGMVLVTGGSTGRSGQDEYIKTAELYDPATGIWTETGDLNRGRFAHTATLLPNGKVLVSAGAGRGNFFQPVASVEIYDPASGIWSTFGRLVAARQFHTATLLPSGDIIVAGGEDTNHIALASTELGARSALDSGGRATVGCASSLDLQPVRGRQMAELLAGTWTDTGSLISRRFLHTATLLPNGKVLVAGGYNETAVYLSRAELYDPADGTWTATARLASAREGHTATLLASGHALICGGYGGAGSGRSAELYDPASETWSKAGHFNHDRSQHTATLLADGKVLVAGGKGRDSFFTALSSAELYDPVSGSWSDTGRLATGRSAHTATLLPNGKVLVAGGYNLTATGPLASAELYDPVSGHWSTTGSLAGPRSEHTATPLPNGTVLVAGGFDLNSLATARAEIYDPASETWTTVGSLNTARRDHTATLLPDGTVLVAGGFDGGASAFASTEIYDPASGAWTATGSLNFARFQHTATLLPDGRVLVAGGVDGDFTGIRSAELYDPTTTR